MLTVKLPLEVFPYRLPQGEFLFLTARRKEAKASFR